MGGTGGHTALLIAAASDQAPTETTTETETMGRDVIPKAHRRTAVRRRTDSAPTAVRTMTAATAAVMVFTLAAPAVALAASTPTAVSSTHPAVHAQAIIASQSYAVSAAVTEPFIARDAVTITAPRPKPKPVLMLSSTGTDQLAGVTLTDRQKIVATAMTYLGTPYVLGGADKIGIDCSGLIMRAYQAVGVDLIHYVPNQDAAGAHIAVEQAQPGDLVVFDNDDHIGIYLGNGNLIAAPHPGADVRIQPVWNVPHHFTRILP